jgi:hypothetical protein
VVTLEDIEEIKQLKARYCRCVDLKLWAEFRQIFSDDCRYVGSAAAAPGPDEFVERVAASLVELKSVHHVHNPEIRPVGDDTARGSWSLQDYLFWEKGARVPPWLKGSEEQLSVVGFGLYEEEYKRTSDGWKIDRMRLSRLALIPLFEQGPMFTGAATLQQVWGDPDPEWIAGGGFKAGAH